MASNLRSQILRLSTFARYITKRKIYQTSASLNSAAAEAAQKPLTIPQPDGEQKVYPPKLEEIFKSISQLNLLEVAELSALLKERLNLPDAPVMSFGAAPAKEPAAEEEAAPKIVQTSFTVKLLKFDEKQKVGIIKEVKNFIPDMNLVQAKKLIESAPVILLKDISKDEAEKMKEALIKVGGEIVVE